MINKFNQGTGKKERVRKFSSLSSKLEVKPLSVNKAYTGRKRRSVWLKGYTTQVLNNLPEGEIPKGVNLEIILHFGVSSKSSDADNCVKPFLDCLQTKYGFNDNQFYHVDVYKKIVNKGEEYIRWMVKKYNGAIDER